MSSVPIKPKTVLFIHLSVDDFGLSTTQYRVLMHVARCGDCWGSLETIAQKCRINRNTAIACLRVLVAHKVLVKTKRTGYTGVYQVNQQVSEWLPIQDESTGNADVTPGNAGGATSACEHRVNSGEQVVNNGEQVVNNGEQSVNSREHGVNSCEQPHYDGGLLSACAHSAGNVLANGRGASKGEPGVRQTESQGGGRKEESTGASNGEAQWLSLEIPLMEIPPIMVLSSPECASEKDGKAGELPPMPQKREEVHEFAQGIVGQPTKYAEPFFLKVQRGEVKGDWRSEFVKYSFDQKRKDRRA